MTLEITKELIESYEMTVINDPLARLAMNSCWKTDPLTICTQRTRARELNHVFAHKVENDGKPVTNQKSAGTCWIFAALNVMRLPFMKHLNIDEFEFSQAYLFFWDKIERCNYFLNKMVELAKKGEEVEGRLVSFLLEDPVSDGGQWDMLINLIVRYGVLPKICFPESYSTEASSRMNTILRTKLREYTHEIRTAVEKDEDVNSLLKRQMSEVFRIVSICLSIPPRLFTWEYYDKSKNYHKIGPISPLNFYEEHVKPVFNIEDKICIVTDPRPKNSYGEAYTVDCLGNMVGGKLTIYNNQPVETLMNLAAESIKNNEAVWFGCEIFQRFFGKMGIQDIDIHNYKSVFGVDVCLGMSKADRLLYGESKMTHAMVLTAVTCDENNVPEKWRVENSWGEDRGDKGHHVLTSDWFKEFVFEVIVDKKFVPEEVLAVFKKEPVVLPAWDPMGALARSCEGVESDL